MKSRRVAQPTPQVIALDQSHNMAEAHTQAAELARQGLSGAWVVQCLHDPGCRAIHSQNDRDCRKPCAPELYLLSIGAFAGFMQFDRQMQQARDN